MTVAPSPTPPAGSPLAVFVPLDPARVVRYVYVGRLTIALAIFAAAVARWLDATVTQTLFASVSLVAAMGFTAASVVWTEIWERPLTRPFRYAQTLFDLVLVSAIVLATGGASSPFVAVYVLVIAVASLWLPVGSSLLVATLGCALYAFVTFVMLETRVGGTVLLQSAVFGAVAIGAATVAERLRGAGAGSERLAEELVLVRLQAADVLGALESGVITVDGGGRLLYANAAAGRLLGMPMDGREGRPILDAIERRAPALAEALARTAREGRGVPRTETDIAVQGRTFPLAVTTTVVGSESADRSATAIFADVSDQRRVAELRTSAQRLEAVAELSASLAHEIRNPLAAIRSAVEQLASRAPADTDERALASLIVREADRLSRLLGEFLDFARVRPAIPAPIDGVALLRDTAAVIRSHPDCGPATRVEPPPADDTCPFEGDADLLMRALVNLALNAAQAMPEGGRLWLEADPSPAALPAEAAALGVPVVALRVRDTGPGLADEVRARIFQPFITTRPGGHGLGLPVAFRAVEAHRGVILVDSGPTGTTFSLYLPRAFAARSDQP